MSEWRPEGWKNPWSNPDVIVEFDKHLMAMRTADGTTPERVLAEDRRDIYEAGANAILAALRDCTDSCHTGRGSFTRMAEYLSLFCNPGTLVFIPDEE